MGDYEDKAPDLAAVLPEASVLGEVYVPPPPEAPKEPPPLTAQQMRQVVKWASVYGLPKSLVPEEKRAFAGKSIEDAAAYLGINRDRVASLLYQYQAFVAVKAPKQTAQVKTKGSVED